MEGLASGRAAINSGCLKAIQILTGEDIKCTEGQLAVDSICSMGPSNASSRTQRVVSLSSCEAELHAMISCLCDGIFLRRCIPTNLVTTIGWWIPHRHVKLLYVRAQANSNILLANCYGFSNQCLRDKYRLCKFLQLGISLTWGQNLLEVLGSKYCCTCLVQQKRKVPRSVDKHGSLKQIKVLSKSIARVLLIMGLGPGFMEGAAGASMMDDDSLIDAAQCMSDPNTLVTQQPAGFSWMFIFLCIAGLASLAYFLFKVYKMAHDAFTSFEPLYTAVAVLESLADSFQKDLASCRAEIQRLRSAHDEVQGEVEMVSDSVDSVHWGLIHIGGYGNFEQLSPAERQRMFSTERANLIAARSMGMQRYLHVVRQSNRGIVDGGQDTDMEGYEFQTTPTWIRS
eukprot:s2167_g9.t1